MGGLHAAGAHLWEAPVLVSNTRFRAAFSRSGASAADPTLATCSPRHRQHCAGASVVRVAAQCGGEKRAVALLLLARRGAGTAAPRRVEIVDDLAGPDTPCCPFLLRFHRVVCWFLAQRLSAKSCHAHTLVLKSSGKVAIVAHFERL